MEDTIEDYSQVLNLTPDDAKAYNNRGLAFDALGDYDRALGDYGRAVTLRPDFAESLSNRGAASEALGKTEEALDDYLAALTAAPNFAAAHYNAARLYAQLRDVDKCLPHLEKAMRLVPELRSDADEDDELGWVLKLRRLKQERGSGTGEAGA